MADQKISDLNAATSIADADLLTIVQSGSNKKITGETFRSVMGYIQKKVTVSNTGLSTLGTVPVTIIAAPGANKYLLIHTISASYNYGSAVYNFTDDLVFKTGEIVFALNNSRINGGTDFNAKILPYYATALTLDILITTNTALTLTTNDAADPSTGDGDLDVVVYYSIEDVNT